jgi:hypothetical protein
MSLIDQTEAETKAMDYAKEMAGEYIEYAISKNYTTDLSNWPAEIYDEFISVIASSYSERFAEERIPF